MGELIYNGRAVDVNDSVAYRSYVQGVQAGALTQTDVDNRITSQMAPYVLKSYVDTQDALLTTKSYTDTQDSARLLLSRKGATNGVASLDSSGKVPSAQLTLGTAPSSKAQYSPPSYAGGSYTVNQPAANYVTIATLTIPNPGFTYRMMIWGYFECIGPNARPEVAVTVDGDNANYVARGEGCIWNNYHPVNVRPYGTMTHTGAHTFVARGRATPSLGSGAVTFTTFKANLVGIVVPA